MAKVKNKRENHFTKRPKSGSSYGESEGTREMRINARGKVETRVVSNHKGSASVNAKSSAGKANGGNKGKGANVGKGKGSPKPSEYKFKDKKFEKYDGYPEKAERREEDNAHIIVGRNPVTEALKAGREIDKLLVSSREGSMIKILAMAKDQGIPVMYVEKAALDRVSNGQVHQGVAAYISPYSYSTMDDIYEKAEKTGEKPFIIILDGLEDPHNLGAVMRTAECAGAHGIIIPKRHSCGLTETVAKSSAGAIEYMPVVKVTNIAQTVDELKERGIWVAACDMGGQEYYKQDMSGAIAVVIGSEGFGISKLVKEKCDFTVSMPMKGAITSLNASNAASVIMYEVRRQRNLAQR